MDHMRTTSLVAAKAHLSELVDAAEHRGVRILILRRGKPAAAIVPVDAAEARRRRAPKRLSPQAFEALLARMADAADSALSLDDALGRNRLDFIG